MSMKIEAAISIKRFAASYDQRRIRRITTASLGATTGRRTTTGALTTAPPRAATQPARYTPAAQTTALASIVLKVMKPPSSNREMITCFVILLLGLRWDQMILALRLSCACAKLLTSVSQSGIRMASRSMHIRRAHITLGGAYQEAKHLRR
jgi:hypothetical protein